MNLFRVNHVKGISNVAQKIFSKKVIYEQLQMENVITILFFNVYKNTYVPTGFFSKTEWKFC